MSGADFYGFYIINIGVNGTGKTTHQKKMLFNHPRVFVIPSSEYDISASWPECTRVKPRVGKLHDLKKGKDVRTWFVPNLNELYGKYVLDLSDVPENQQSEAVNSVFRNRGGIFAPPPHSVALIIDDMKNYIPGGGDLPAAFKQLLVSRRQRRIHLSMAVHMFSDVNPRLLGYGPELHVFATDLAPSDEVLKKLGSKAGEFEACRIHVNQVANQKDESGKYTNRHYMQPFSVRT